MAKLKEHWKNRRGDRVKDIPEGVEPDPQHPLATRVNVVQNKKTKQSIIKDDPSLTELIKSSISIEQFVKKLINSNNPAIQKMVASAIGLKETGEERSYIVKPIVYRVEIQAVKPHSSDERAVVTDTSGQDVDPPIPPKPPEPASRSISSENLFGILANNLTLTPQE